MVSSGAASIRQSGANLSVVQTSPSAIVNWGSFSIGQGNAVTFDQPSASSAILNRVTGSARSTIAGELQANGQVYLVNPNGIAITPTGAVQVGGGFVASTLGIADNDFNKGNLNFVGNGASAGVANAGSIQAGPGGFVGLIGGTVSNSGVVSVPLGKVAMGSGEQATLNLTGDNFLQVAVPTNTKTADGQALIDVSGKVRAAGGSVQLKAATVAQAIRNAVNVPGELSVASARASGGSIILSGGSGGRRLGERTAQGLRADERRNDRDQRPQRRLEPGEPRREQRSGAGRFGDRGRHERGQSRVDGGRRLRRDRRRRHPDRRRLPWRKRHRFGSGDDDRLGFNAEHERYGLGQRRDGRRVVGRHDDFAGHIMATGGSAVAMAAMLKSRPIPRATACSTSSAAPIWPPRRDRSGRCCLILMTSSFRRVQTPAALSPTARGFPPGHRSSIP